jgi:hypothetical protein
MKIRFVTKTKKIVFVPNTTKIKTNFSFSGTLTDTWYIDVWYNDTWYSDGTFSLERKKVVVNECN